MGNQGIAAGPDQLRPRYPFSIMLSRLPAQVNLYPAGLVGPPRPLKTRWEIGGPKRLAGIAERVVETASGEIEEDYEALRWRFRIICLG